MVFDQSMHKDLVIIDHPIQYPKTYFFQKHRTNEKKEKKKQS